MQSSEELSKIVDDVSYIISSKLKDALIPVIQKQSNTETAILNLPFIQKIVNENRVLKIKNAELETKLAVVRENYKRLFLSKVSNEATCSTENNINLEIEEYNVNKKDYDSISKIEQEIIELNKEELDSLEDSDMELSQSQSEQDDDEVEDEEQDEKSNELLDIIKNQPELCKKAIENYKLFYKMQTTPSLEDVFNSAAGIKGWGIATINKSKELEEESQEQEEKEQEEEEKQEEEEEEEEEEQKEEEEKQEDDEEEKEQEEEENEEEEEEEEENEEEQQQDDEDEEVEEEVEEEEEEKEDEQQQDDEYKEEEVEEEEEEEVEEEEEEEEEVEEEVEEEEVNEEQDEDEEEEEEDEEEQEDDEEEDEDEDEDELEVEEIMIKGKMYYTDSNINGDIYRVGEDGDIEEIVGKFEKSQAIFF